MATIKKVTRLFILINYLLKHGPSAYIDNFQEHIKMFKNY